MNVSVVPSASSWGMVSKTCGPPDDPGALVAGVAFWPSATHVVSQIRNMDGQSMVTFSGVPSGTARSPPVLTPLIRLS